MSAGQKAEHRCETCKWYRPLTKEDWAIPHGRPAQGRCRRRAPVAILGHPLGTETEVSANWPVVTNGDFCGEFSAVDGFLRRAVAVFSR